jgi:hypothetical protein
VPAVAALPLDERKMAIIERRIASGIAAALRRFFDKSPSIEFHKKAAETLYDS